MVDGLMRVAIAASTLLCGRADARMAAADLLRPQQRQEAGPSRGPSRREAPVAGGRTRRQEAAAQDAWFGDDKFRHFAMSFATATLTYAAVRSAGADDAALPGAIAVAAAAGIGKEVYDRRAGRIFSLRDLAWDGLGVAAGYAFLRQIE